MATLPQWYVVFVGRLTGIFCSWFGPGGAQDQIHGFSGAVHKSYASASAARKAWRWRKAGKSTVSDRIRVALDGKEAEFPLEGSRYQFLRSSDYQP